MYKYFGLLKIPVLQYFYFWNMMYLYIMLSLSQKILSTYCVLRGLRFQIILIEKR